MKALILPESVFDQVHADTTRWLLTRHGKTEGVYSGEALSQFCSHQQINAFLLFQVFNEWNAQVSRLKNPFFNYQHPEVQDALRQFMNVLSNHISIGADDLRALLEKAVFNNLRLILQPQESLVSFFFQAHQAIPMEVFSQNAVYFKDYGFVIQNILRYHQRNDLRIVQRETFTDLMGKVMALYEQEKGPLDEYREERFFELTGKPLAPIAQAPLAPEVQKTMQPIFPEVKPQQEVIHVPVTEPTTLEKPAEEHPVFMPNESHPVGEITTRVVSEKPIDLFGSQEKVTLADKLREQQSKSGSLHERFGRKEHGQIKLETIPIHKQLQFVKAVFNGDSLRFRAVIEKVNGFSNWNEVTDLLERHVLNMAHVNKDDKVVQEFILLLRNRFT